MARKRKSSLDKAKKLLDFLSDKALVDDKIEFKDVRAVAEAWIKVDMIEKKFAIEDDSEGLSELQRKLHSDLGGGNAG